MKNIKHSRFLFIAVLLLIVFSQGAMAQKNSKNDAKKMSLKNMVDSQNFVFEAQSVTPLRGNFRMLTSPYDVVVSKDTLSSYLPFFGRAYTPQINQTQSPLDFTSTSFSYSVSLNKKGGWYVTIKPKDETDIQQYLFTIFDNGNANLSVTSTSRDAISFNGNVKKKK